MAVITIRFVGGPEDDQVYEMDFGSIPDYARQANVPFMPTHTGLEQPGDLIQPGHYLPMGVADEDGNEMFRWAGIDLPMSKPTFTTHEEAKAEAMKSWSYRFWYYLLWPKYRLIRLWLQLRHTVKRKSAWQ